MSRGRICLLGASIDDRDDSSLVVASTKLLVCAFRYTDGPHDYE